MFMLSPKVEWTPNRFWDSPNWNIDNSLPEPIQGSPFRNGVPVLSPIPIWGQVPMVPKLEQTPNRFWLVTEQSPNQNGYPFRFGDPPIGLGIPGLVLAILCEALSHFALGIPIFV